MEDFSGVFAYLVSALRSDGTVNTEVTRALVEHLMQEGVHGVSPLGSTGEVAYLTEEQRLGVVEAVVAAAGRRLAVIPGVEAFSTQSAIEQAQRYEGMGVDGLILILNTYFPINTVAAASYFRTVAQSVACPVGLYFNPQFTGSGLSVELLERLADVPNIRFIKEASGNTGLLLTVLNRFGDRFQIFSASAHVPLLVMQMGGVGWMGGPVSLVPRQSRRLYDLVQAGEWSEAWKLQKALWEMNRVFQRHGLAACIKAGLTLQGFAVGDPIPPQLPLSAAAIEEIGAALEPFSHA